MKALRDCRACGGGGCRECRNSGIEQVTCFFPPDDFKVRTDDAGFEQDRENCPCYEGIKINQGVDQCMHPGNRESDNWCEWESCPLVRAACGRR